MDRCHHEDFEIESSEALAAPPDLLLPLAIRRNYSSFMDMDDFGVDLRQPLLLRKRTTNTTSQLAIIRANICPIESLDYELKGRRPLMLLICNLPGKSGGTLIQQFMILTFGSLANSTSYLGGILLVIMLAWLGAVRSYSQFSALAKEELQKEIV